MIHLRASEVDGALRKHFAGSGSVVLSQVRNGVGFSKSPRTADMLAISTWPSRGLYAEGIEIKVSRADLVKELASPEKADEIAKYCRYWWLAGPEGLITPEMAIPPTWGIISISIASRPLVDGVPSLALKVKVQKRPEVLESSPMDALFVCSVLRNFAENHTHNDDIKPAIEAAAAAATKDAESRRGYQFDELKKAIQEFKEWSGIDLMDQRGFHPRWDIRNIGEAVRMLIALQDRPIEELQRAMKALDTAKVACEFAIGSLLAGASVI